LQDVQRRAADRLQGQRRGLTLPEIAAAELADQLRDLCRIDRRRGRRRQSQTPGEFQPEREDQESHAHKTRSSAREQAGRARQKCTPVGPREYTAILSRLSSETSKTSGLATDTRRERKTGFDPLREEQAKAGVNVCPGIEPGVSRRVYLRGTTGRDDRSASSAPGAGRCPGNGRSWPRGRRGCSHRWPVPCP